MTSHLLLALGDEFFSTNVPAAMEAHISRLGGENWCTFRLDHITDPWLQFVFSDTVIIHSLKIAGFADMYAPAHVSDFKLGIGSSVNQLNTVKIPGSQTDMVRL